MSGKKSKTDAATLAGMNIWDAARTMTTWDAAKTGEPVQPASTAGSENQDDFSDIEMSPTFKPLKKESPNSSVDDMDAVTGPAETKAAEPEKIALEVLCSKIVSSRTVENSDNCDGSPSFPTRPARSKTPMMMTGFAAVAVAAFVGVQKWPTATASIPNKVETWQKMMPATYVEITAAEPKQEAPIDTVLSQALAVPPAPMRDPVQRVAPTLPSTKIDLPDEATMPQKMAAVVESEPSKERPVKETAVQSTEIYLPDEATMPQKMAALVEPEPTKERPVQETAVQSTEIHLPDEATVPEKMAALGEPEPIVDRPRQPAAAQPAPVEDPNFSPRPSLNETTRKSPDKLSRAECAERFKELSNKGSINFEFGTDTPTKSSFPILNAFTKLSVQCRDYNVVVRGHTDSLGDAAFNQGLSEKRANCVAEHLVRTGVPEQSLRVVGYGESKPIASNDTEEQRIRNRRIEFLIDDN